MCVLGGRLVDEKEEFRGMIIGVILILIMIKITLHCMVHSMELYKNKATLTIKKRHSM